LRGARGSYGHAIRRHLAAAEFDDLPRNSAFVLGGMANWGISATDLIRDLRSRNKQPANSLMPWFFAAI